MTNQKSFKSRFSDLKSAMAMIAKLPGIFTQAIEMWGDCEMVIQPFVPKRSLDQNRLQRLWCKEASQQLEGNTQEDWRGYCKLHFGIPILRRDSPEFREVYDRLIRPRPYEEKLEIMKEPIDFQVTRIMSKPQKSEYLQLIYEFFTGLGVRLTEPGMQGRENYKEAA